MTLFAKHSIIKLGLLLLIAIMAPAAALLAQVQATYYVDPINGSNSNSGTSVGAAFNTIDKARDVVRTINSNMTGDIYIYLRGGTYQLDSTLRFTDSDEVPMDSILFIRLIMVRGPLSAAESQLQVGRCTIPV